MDLNAQTNLAKCKLSLCKVVKKAKKTYYQKVIEELDIYTIFNLVKWSKSVRLYTTPPI